MLRGGVADVTLPKPSMVRCRDLAQPLHLQWHDRAQVCQNMSKCLPARLHSAALAMVSCSLREYVAEWVDE